MSDTNPSADASDKVEPSGTNDGAAVETNQPELANQAGGFETPPTAADAPPSRTYPPGPMSAHSGLPTGLCQNMVDLETIPKAAKNVVGNHRTMPIRENSKLRPPNQMVNMSTVTMTNRAREKSQRIYYNNYVETRKPRKVITWDEATSARPPLRVDMEGPTACSYSPRNKPLFETNAPSWSFGRKTFVEKPGGGRTSWEKTWFQNPDVWTQKADFYSDRRWPAPPTHKQAHSIGSRLTSLHTSPQHTFGYRRNSSIQKKGAEFEPSPNEYNVAKAAPLTLPKSPAYSHSHRRGGTCLWSYTETSPGPGTYKPEFSYARIKSHHPSFSIRGMRREQTHELGPFAAF